MDILPHALPTPTFLLDWIQHFKLIGWRLHAYPERAAMDHSSLRPLLHYLDMNYTAPLIWIVQSAAVVTAKRPPESFCFPVPLAMPPAGLLHMCVCSTSHRRLTQTTQLQCTSGHILARSKPIRLERPLFSGMKWGEGHHDPARDWGTPSVMQNQSRRRYVARLAP